MPSRQEDDQTPVNRTDRELSPQEDKDELKTPERRHIDTLLDISEEIFMKELEPYDYHYYSEWEDTLCSWARASPLSCILTTHTSHKKPKHKEADNLPPVDPTTTNADHLASVADTHLKSLARPHSSKKSQPLNFQTDSRRQTAVADNQQHASDLPGLNAMGKNAAHFFSEEKKQEETHRDTPLHPWPLSSKYSLLESRRTKPTKKNHKPNKIFVPIKTITFLPSIKPLQPNPKIYYHDCRGQKTPYVETFENNLSMFDKRSGRKGTRVDTVVDSELTRITPTSKYQTCQYNPHLFSTLCNIFPMRYQVPLSSKFETALPIRHPMGKNFPEAMAQPHMHPCSLFSTRQCAVSGSMMPLK